MIDAGNCRRPRRDTRARPLRSCGLGQVAPGDRLCLPGPAVRPGDLACPPACHDRPARKEGLGPGSSVPRGGVGGPGPVVSSLLQPRSGRACPALSARRSRPLGPCGGVTRALLSLPAPSAPRPRLVLPRCQPCALRGHSGGPCPSVRGERAPRSVCSSRELKSLRVTRVLGAAWQVPSRHAAREDEAQCSASPSLSAGRSCASRPGLPQLGGRRAASLRPTRATLAPSARRREGPGPGAGGPARPRWPGAGLPLSLQPAVGLAVRQARPLCALRGLKEHVSPGLGRDGGSRRHVLNRPRSQEEAALRTRGRAPHSPGGAPRRFRSRLSVTRPELLPEL